MKARRDAALALGAGMVAGTVIGATARALETSRIGLGPYALYGNGALAVPAVMGPLAIFAGWIWLMRGGMTPVGPMVLYVVGLDLGAGVAYNALAGSLSAEAIPSILFSFGIFILPTAGLAAITIAVLAALRWDRSVVALAIVFAAGAVLPAVPPFLYLGGLGGAGITTGTAVVAVATSTATVRIAVGAGLLLLLLVQVFGLPALLLPS